MILAALTALQLSAQSTISVKAPNLVAMDEDFNVTFIVEGEKAPSSFEWDQGEDFQMVWGPQKGTSTSISIINGKTTKSVQNTYSYVLRAKKTGTFTLPTASALVDGAQILSKRTSIEVLEAQEEAASKKQQSSDSGSDASASGEILLRWTPSKTDVMIGEPFTMTLTLLQNANVTGCNISAFPDISGFKVEEIQAPQQLSYHRENVGGKIFNAALLRSFRFTPEKSGDLTVGPVELNCEISVRTGSRVPGFPFSDLIGDDYITKVRRVSSKSATIHVRPIPADAPASFCGGLGSNFSIKASVSADSLKSHDAASLKVTVTGEGNRSKMEAPKVNFPPDFEVFDVKPTESGNSVTYEYPFIPRSHGDFTIPGIEYSYLDVKTRKFVTLTTAPIDIHVEKGADIPAASGSGQMVGGAVKRDVRDLGSDIRFIKTGEQKFSPAGKFFTGSAAMWLTAALLVLLAAAAYFAMRTIASRRSDVVWTRKRSASKMARRKLARAGEYLQKNLYSAFYEELHKALLGFVSDKFSMDAGELSKDNIADTLVAGGVSEGIARDYVSLLDACEYARYSPDAGHDAMNAHYESAVEVISAIDSGMKKGVKVKGAAAVAALVLMMSAAVPGRAADTPACDSLWQAGAAYYTEGQWVQAADSWAAIISQGIESPDLYYNLGNAYFRQGDNARAILNYERALRLDPSHADARFNLEFVNSLTSDKIEAVPEFFLEAWGRKMCWTFPSNVWAVLFIVMLAVTLALALLFLLSRRPALRKAGFFAGIAALLLCLVCLDFAFWQKTDYASRKEAIIMVPVSSAKSSPGAESSVDLFILHEGAKVRIIDEVGKWRNIELSDGRKGWIHSDDMEKI